jgi:uncharacterized membrane protein
MARERPAPLLTRQQERRQTLLYRRIVTIMNAGFGLGVGLMLLGILLAVVRGQPIGEETDPLREIVPKALRLDARAVAELGLLVLLTTPLAYIVAALLIFLRQRDRLFAGVCVALVVILVTSIGVALL